MKPSILTKLLLVFSLILSILLIGYVTHKLKAIPKANISSVLNVLDDDMSGITWNNQTTIKLGSTSTFSGTGVTIDGSHILISQGGNYTLSGTLTNGSITVNTTSPVNLTLNNVSITNLSGPAIYIMNAETAYITLPSHSKNYLIDSPSHSDPSLDSTLMSNAPLTFQGKGSIKISAQYKQGISCSKALTIHSGNFDISSPQDDSK